MKELPFDPYDFFGYIASGLVLVALAQVVFGFPRVIGTDLKAFDVAITILTVYIVGQIVAGPAKLLLEDLLVHRVLGSPTENLLRSKAPRFRKLLFPGFYRPLPSVVRSKVEAKIEAFRPAPHDSEGIFLTVRYSPEILKDERLLVRIDKFRDLYGFNRNVSFSLLLAATVLLVLGRIQARASLVHFGIVATVAGVLLLYRFLKFYRQYSYELLNCYACMSEKGKADV
jgi:hypothetical protein